MEKLESLCIIGRNVEWCSHNRKYMEVPQQIENCYHKIQQIQFWLYIQKKTKDSSWRYFGTMFMAAFFTIAIR